MFCVLLMNFGFEVCVDAIFNIDDKWVFISGLWFHFMSRNCTYDENTLYKYVTKHITHVRSKMSNVWKRNNEVLAAQNDEMTNRFTLSNLTTDFTALRYQTFLFINCNIWAVFHVLEIFESHRRNSNGRMWLVGRNFRPLVAYSYAHVTLVSNDSTSNHSEAMRHYSNLPVECGVWRLPQTKHSFLHNELYDSSLVGCL